MRVLLVEDDPTTQQSVRMMLESASMVVDTTDLGEDGLEISKLYDYDIIILDLMLPDIGGMEVLRRLRDSRIETPVLILSGLTGSENKVKGLGIGADDYLTKPFNKEELLARIQAIVRRSQGHSQSVIQTGMLMVNLDARTIEVNGQPIQGTLGNCAMVPEAAQPTEACTEFALVVPPALREVDLTFRLENPAPANCGFTELTLTFNPTASVIRAARSISPGRTSCPV